MARDVAAEHGSARAKAQRSMTVLARRYCSGAIVDPREIGLDASHGVYSGVVSDEGLEDASTARGPRDIEKCERAEPAEWLVSLTKYRCKDLEDYCRLQLQPVSSYQTNAAALSCWCSFVLWWEPRRRS